MYGTAVKNFKRKKKKLKNKKLLKKKLLMKYNFTNHQKVNTETRTFKSDRIIWKDRSSDLLFPNNSVPQYSNKNASPFGSEDTPKKQECGY